MADTGKEPDSALAKLLEKLDLASKVDSSANPDDEPLEEDPKVDEVPGNVKFEGSEHRAIGDAVKLYDINGKELDAATYIVQTITRNGTDLTLGRVISLAGDFYSNRNPTGLHGWTAEYAPICGAYYDSPIKTPEGRFSDMVSAMLLDDFNYMNDIKGALDLEKQEIDNSLKGTDGGSTARTFHDAKNTHGDAWFTAATSLAYPKISWQNADHFVSPQSTSPFSLLIRSCRATTLYSATKLDILWLAMRPYKQDWQVEPAREQSCSTRHTSSKHALSTTSLICSLLGI